jgi:hypothetical protein
MMHLFTNPERTAKSLDTLLSNGEKPLLDPSTGEDFVYKSIPIELFPEINASVKFLINHSRRESYVFNGKDQELLLRLA